MKTLHLKLSLLLLVTILKGTAQVVDELNEAGYNNNSENLQIRHLKGMASIDFQYGYAKYTSFYNFGYGKLLNDKLNFNLLLNYELGKINYTKVDYKNLMIGVGYTPLKLQNVVFFTLTGGGIVGFVKSNNEEISKSESKFNAGAYGGVNIETYLFNKLSLILKAEQQYNFMDPFGNYHYNLGAGIRIYFY
jgi:hypothetical protein